MSFSVRIRKFATSLHVNVTAQNFSSFVSENETKAHVLYKKGCVTVNDETFGKRKHYRPPQLYKPTFLKSLEVNNFSYQTELFNEVDVKESCERAREILLEIGLHAPMNLLFAIEGKECTHYKTKRTQSIAYYLFEVVVKNKLHVSVGNIFSLKNVSKDLEKLRKELALAKLPVVKPHSLRGIILESQVVGTLFHEFAHLLEFDRSSWKIKRIIGKRIFDRKDLTVIEKPRMESFGFNMITDEGIETKDIVLVKDGKVKEPIDSVVFRYEKGCCGYSETANELALPRTVNLYASIDDGEPYNSFLENEVALIKNVAAFPVNFNPLNVLLDITRIQGVLLKGNKPSGILTGNINLRLSLKHLIRDAVFSCEKGGKEPGFCIKHGQKVRSTQIAPAALLRENTLELFLRAISNIR